MLVKAVCEKKRHGNEADSGWLCSLARRSRTKDDDYEGDRGIKTKKHQRQPSSWGLLWRFLFEEV